ncbi:MAG: amidohydrolase family protein, partial [Candidatus Eiseniibacteriota bacterium]
HAELPGPIAAAAEAVRGGDPRRYATWLASRPAVAELEAIRMVLGLCAETGCPVHIVHLSAAEALAELKAARARGLPVTVETCPHYLAFTAEEIADGATPFKCAPPIRGRANRDRLWVALRDGAVDLIASDHSPCPPGLKARETGDFMTAWGGIASLQVALSAAWTGARERGFTPADLARWMSERPARLAGLAGVKGGIVRGADADLLIWEPEAEWKVEGARLYHRHSLTPYEGRMLRGVVRSTFVRGERVFERVADGQAILPEAPTGRLLERTAPAVAGRGERGAPAPDGLEEGGAVDRAGGSR